MLDLDIGAICAATGFDEPTVIKGLILYLKRRLGRSEGKIKTDYALLVEFCEYLNSTGSCLSSLDVDDFLDVKGGER